MAEETLKLFLRFRDEEAEGVMLVDSRSIYLQKNAQNRQLQLTGILHSTDDQNKVYQTLGKRSVEKFLQGYSSMFFLYGAAETGKTYTLLGDENHLDNVIDTGGVGYKERGLIVRAMQQIFRKSKSQQKQKQYSIYCSCMEISKIKISDLSQCNNKTRLRIQQNKSGWFTAVNLHYNPIKDMNDFLKYFKSILQLRQFSNSHLIFQINLVQQDIINRNQQPIQSYITFVELGFINHNEELEEQQQMLVELSSLSTVLSKINNLHNIQQGFKQSRLTRILKQSICNSENITLIGTVGKYNSYVENAETINFLKIAKQPQSITNSQRILTVRKSRRSIKLKYETASNNDKDETNSYGVSSANTLKRRESYLQITKHSEGYDRVQYLIGERMENDEIIKELETNLNQLKTSKTEIQKKYKLKKDALCGNIASLKYTMTQLRLNQQNALKTLSQKYQKFLQQQNTPQINLRQSENARTITSIPSKRIPDQKLSLSLARDQQRKTIRNILDERDDRLNMMRRQHEREVARLQEEKYNLELKIDPYKATVYKQTLKQIKELSKVIQAQERYIKNMEGENVDQYELMKILNQHKFAIKPFSAEIQKLLKQIQGVKDMGLNGFKEKADSYLKSQAFIVKTHKSRNSQSRINLLL